MLIEDRIDVTQRTKTDEGFLVVPATFARVGIQAYTARQVGIQDGDPMRLIRVYRPPEEVFRPESLKSFERKPVTNEHPPAGTSVTADNAREYAVGMSGEEVVQDGQFVKGSITIHDGNAVRAVESGKRQVSLGYECEFEMTSGKTQDGLDYDAIQRNIRGNHIAIVARGRCGPACSIADGAECDGTCNHEGGDPVKTQKIKVGDSEFEVPESVAQHIARLTTDMEEAEKKAKDMEEAKAKADEDKKKSEDEAEEAKKAKDKAEAARDAALENTVSKDEVQALVADQAELLVVAKRLEPTLDAKGLSANQIRREVVKAKLGDSAIEGKSDAYIEGRFEALAEGGGESARFDRRNPITEDGADTRTGPQKAHDEASNALENAWKKSAA